METLLHAVGIPERNSCLIQCKFMPIRKNLPCQRKPIKFKVRLHSISALFVCTLQLLLVCMCMQDMCRFFGFSLLVQVLLFVVGLSGGWHHAQSTTELVQRALDTVIAAIPVGKVTCMSCCLKLLVLCLWDCSYHALHDSMLRSSCNTVLPAPCMFHTTQECVPCNLTVDKLRSPAYTCLRMLGQQRV